MIDDNERLAHALKIKFGLAPGEPDSQQLAAIKAAISRIEASGRKATDVEWRAIVAAACPGAGRHRYAGEDNSDLNTLVALALSATKG